jgi:IS5 family transposase
MYQHLPLQDRPKFTQIWTFGLKICHLATLVSTNIDRNAFTRFIATVNLFSDSCVFFGPSKKGCFRHLSSKKAKCQFGRDKRRNSSLRFFREKKVSPKIKKLVSRATRLAEFSPNV